MVDMVIRADHIGSLQRPARLLQEVHRIYERGHTAKLAEERGKDLGRLTELEDEAIREAVKRQEDVGLNVVTDGEFRRIAYFNSFFDAVDGIEASKSKLPFRGDDGSVVEYEGPAEIARKLSIIDNPAAREAAFLAKLTEKVRKVTFPTASFLVAQALMGRAVSSEAYGSADELADALVDILKELVVATIGKGANYVQFDVSGYMMVARGPFGAMLQAKGIDLDALLTKMLEADTRLVADLPENVITCLHQCRGNYASRYLANHDRLHELGEAFFALPYKRFTLEWDGHVERSEADYAALERVPKGGATVVLGVVSTRHPALESEDQIMATIERATKHIALDQLAISPQCGFASALTTGDDDRPDGNVISQEAQWRKLELLVKSANRIWGTA
jgi:methionine synthase II (cobalamin-independent)